MKVVKKKLALWIVGILLSPLILFILLVIALYIPPVQRFAVGVATDYASKQTGMDISIEDVRLRFPLDLKLDGVKAFKQNDSIKTKTDTILIADNIICDVKLMPLFDSQVEIDAFNLEGVKVNTSTFIHSARVQGKLDKLTVQSHCLDLSVDTLMLNGAYIKGADVDIALSDTVPEDTTKSENYWKIRADRLTMENSAVKVHMPGDTLSFGINVADLQCVNGFFDLGKSSYKVAKLDATNFSGTYDDNFTPTVSGLDYNHISFTNANLGIDNFTYADSRLSLFVRNCSLKEKSGIEVSSLSSHINLDTLSIHLPDFVATTPSSNIKARVDLDFNFMDEKSPGQLVCDLTASLGKQDLMMFMGDMPQTFRNLWPTQPLAIRGVIRGNMQKVFLNAMNIQLPTAFRCNADGWMTNLMDPDHLCANLNLDATTYKLDFIKGFVDPSLFKTINIPSGIMAKGLLRITNLYKYDTDMTIREGGGILAGDAHIDVNTMVYKANLTAKSINLGHFVNGIGLGPLSGKLVANGQGTDIYTSSTKIDANAEIHQLSYGKYDLSGTTARINLSGGRCHAVIETNNQLISGNIDLEAMLGGRIVKGTLSADISNMDFYKLGFVENPLDASVCCHVDIETNKNDYFKVQGLISDMTIRDTANVYRPDDVVMDVLTDRTKTNAIVDCGDFHLNSEFEGGYKHLMNTSDRLVAQIKGQIKKRTIDDIAIRKALPVGHLSLHTGKENPIASAMKLFDLGLSHADVDLTSTEGDGLNGIISIDTLRYSEDIQLDTINVVFESDSAKINYNVFIQNGADNPTACFRAEANGHLGHDGLTALARIYDDKEKLGIQISMLASVQPEGLRLHIDDTVPLILGYKQFSVNTDNYMLLQDNKRISAKLEVESENGTGLQVYTNDENTEALQDITISVSNFELSHVMGIVPYVPKMSGQANGDFHIILTPESKSVSSDIKINKFFYENCPMGDMEVEFVYMPKDDYTHYVDGILYQNDKEVAKVTGTYDTRGGGNVEATLKLEDFPLEYVNGFIPDQIIGFDGKGQGELTLKGSLKKPDVDGEVFLEGSHLLSVPYGVNMRFDDDPVRIIDSKLLLENFQMYANNNQPLICYGSIDFSDLDHMRMDLRMKAENFLAIDAKENRRSEAYGKGYVNFFGVVTGEMDKLRVFGKLDILAKSNIYYILRDSPITNDNRLKELVTFTDFNGDVPVQVVKPTVDGMMVNLDINIVHGTHVKCWLNANHSNFVDILGGGNLKLSYNQRKLSLTGRYTMTDGEMLYSMHVIPLKTFKISSGSYVEFTGDVMNPTLNITALEETKAAVTLENVNQMVRFNCGVILSKTVNDMGLEFTIDAPENEDIHQQLKYMSVEERGKLAVSMLTTGMYLADGNTSAFSMNGALSSFLSQEINNISGNALRTLDLSVGIESSSDEYGTMHTDYSFKFAKRFWNNRLSISVGGKISTGPDVSGQNKSFFDNVDVQYRLGDDSNQYLRLFYQHSVYDYLEGYVSQYGGGYMWKRHLRSFKDIFRFKEVKEEIPEPPSKPFGDDKLFTPDVVPVDSVKK